MKRFFLMWVSTPMTSQYQKTAQILSGNVSTYICLPLSYFYVFSKFSQTLVSLLSNSFRMVYFGADFYVLITDFVKTIFLLLDSVTFTATKAKVMVIYHIIDKLLKLDIGDSKNTIFASSVLQDASRDSGIYFSIFY